MNYASFRAMRRHAATDSAVRARLETFMHRDVEELCYLAVDPDCLINLADDPAHAAVLAELRAALRDHMVLTNDYALEAFDARNDPAQLLAFMQRQHAAARDRAERLQWRRGDNLAGETGSNRDLLRTDQR
jgi:N-sulfoglucosamine sulfohydrolase